MSCPTEIWRLARAAREELMTALHFLFGVQCDPGGEHDVGPAREAIRGVVRALDRLAAIGGADDQR